MIHYAHGDITKDRSEALVNLVNCVGIMGRGLALAFKRTFPANFVAYERACKLNEVEPGRMFVYATESNTAPLFIINFPTKRHWREESHIEDISAGLQALVSEIRERGIGSVAIPPLGCGLGGLDWADVRPQIEQALSTLPDVIVTIYEP